MAGKKRSIYSCTFCEMPKNIFVSCMNCNALVIYDKEKNKSCFVDRFPGEKNDSWRLHNYAIEHDNSIYFMPDRSKYIHIYNVEKSKFKKVLVNIEGRINATYAVRIENYIVFASIEQKIMVLFEMDSHELSYIKLPADAVLSMEIITKDGKVYLADKAKDCIYEYVLGEKDIKIIRIKADGNGFGTISSDGKAIYLTSENSIIVIGQSNIKKFSLNYPNGFGMHIIYQSKERIITGFQDVEKRHEKPFAFSRWYEGKLLLFPFRTNMILELDVRNDMSISIMHINEEEENIETLYSKQRITHCHYFPCSHTSGEKINFISTCSKKLYIIEENQEIKSYMIAIENVNDLYKGEDGYICRVEDKDDNLRDFIRDLLKEDKK